MTDDEALLEGARVAGGFIDDNGDGVFPGLIFGVAIPRIALPAYVAELLVAKVQLDVDVRPIRRKGYEVTAFLRGNGDDWKPLRLLSKSLPIALIRAALVALGHEEASNYD